MSAQNPNQYNLNPHLRSEQARTYYNAMLEERLRMLIGSKEALYTASPPLYKAMSARIAGIDNSVSHTDTPRHTEQASPSRQSAASSRPHIDYITAIANMHPLANTQEATTEPSPQWLDDSRGRTTVDLSSHESMQQPAAELDETHQAPASTDVSSTSPIVEPIQRFERQPSNITDMNEWKTAHTAPIASPVQAPIDIDMARQTLVDIFKDTAA